MSKKEKRFFFKQDRLMKNNINYSELQQFLKSFFYYLKNEKQHFLYI